MIKKETAITLIALVVTIVVLLILAGVTIVTLTGDNNIITKGNEAKTSTEIAEEKEKIKLALNADLIANSGENNTKEGIQSELNDIEDANDILVIKDGKDSYIIRFQDTQRNYKVDEEKNIEGPIDVEMINELYAGDITKNGTLDGENNPYQINCIEDLVAFSKMSETNDFENKKIILERNLDFESELSYANWENKNYGDINNDGKTDALMIELTTGTGFNPINNFKGYFNGNGKNINNLHEQISEKKTRVALFAKISSNAVIRDISCNIDYFGATKSGIAGIIGGIIDEVPINVKNVKIINVSCTGKIIDILGNSKWVGGIIGVINESTDVTIQDCSNMVNIEASCALRWGDRNDKE